MTDSSTPITSTNPKRVLRRKLWSVLGLMFALVGIGSVLVASLSQLQVGMVSQIMTMIICFLPVLLILLLTWLVIAAAIYGVNRLEISVTRQLTGLENRAHDAQLRARTAGNTLGQEVSRAAARFDKVLSRFTVFDAPNPNKDSFDEQ